MRGDVSVLLQSRKWRQQPYLPRDTEPLPAHQRIDGLPDKIEVLGSKVRGHGALGWRRVAGDALQQCELLLERCRAHGRRRLGTELVSSAHEPGLPGAHQGL